MEILRATLGLDPQAYATDERLMEISYGEWEGTDAAGNRGAHARACWRGASATNGISRRPAAKAIASSQARIGEWYASLTRDTVVAAHGGGVRAY